MGKFDGWLICSDFDGTMYINRQVSEENRQAIAYFQREGGYFTYSSGRFPTMLDDLGLGVNANAPMITMNGALICSVPDENGVRRELYRGALDAGDALSYAFSLYDRFDSVSRLVIYFGNESAEYAKKNEPIDRKEFVRRLPPVLLKIMLYVSAEDAEERFAGIRREVGAHFSVTRSWLRGIEINALCDNKGTAARRVKAMLGAKHLVCVGDYDNDLDMIRAADIGYAVGNAVPALKAAADRVTVPAAEHAIAAIVRDIEAEIGTETKTEN